MRSPLLSMVEIVFGLAMLVVGVLGLRQSIQLRNAPPPESLTEPRSPQELALTLFNDRVMHEPDPARKPTAFVFLNRVLAGQEWIHTAENSPEPVPIEPGSRMYWCCRVSRNEMDSEDYRKDATPIHTYKEKEDIRELAILIYRDYKPGGEQSPAAKFRTRIIPETAKWDKRDEKKDVRAGAPGSAH